MPEYLTDYQSVFSLTFSIYLIIFSPQDRLHTINDLDKPELTYYFFHEPDYNTDMATTLKSTVESEALYGKNAPSFFNF